MEQSSSEIIDGLISDANEKLKWAQEKAREFLETANAIEAEAAFRADKYRELAAVMVEEARSYCDETADLLTAEFPMDVPDTEGGIDIDVI